MSITSGDPVGGRRASGPILLISQYPEVIHSHVLGVVVTESELPDGTWRDVLSSLDDVPDPALLIVVSRLAGERLWADVLNRCGFDVLAKPFARDEVTRVTGHALDTYGWLPKRPPAISEEAASRRKSAIRHPARHIGYGS
jgi:DNA-binding NtrC family response regulator